MTDILYSKESKLLKINKHCAIKNFIFINIKHFRAQVLKFLCHRIQNDVRLKSSIIPQSALQSKTSVKYKNARIIDNSLFYAFLFSFLTYPTYFAVSSAFEAVGIRHAHSAHAR